MSSPGPGVLDLMAEILLMEWEMVAGEEVVIKGCPEIP